MGGHPEMEEDPVNYTNTTIQKPMASAESIFSTKEAFFLRSVILVLSATSVAKLLSAFGNAPILGLPNDVLPFSNRHLMILAATFEFAVVAYLLFLRTSFCNWVSCCGLLL